MHVPYGHEMNNQTYVGFVDNTDIGHTSTYKWIYDAHSPARHPWNNPPSLTTEFRMDVSSKERELSDGEGLNASLRAMSASQGGQRRCDGSAIFAQVTTRGV